MIPPIKSWNDVGAEQKAPEARLENRGLEAGLEAPKSRPGRSKIGLLVPKSSQEPSKIPFLKHV